MQIGCQHVVAHFFERRDIVHDPKRAAVCGQNQIMIARMDLDVVHRNRGQPVLHALPVGSAVEGNEKAKLRSGEQQISIFRILADHMDGAGFLRDAVTDARPGVAVVGGHV